MAKSVKGEDGRVAPEDFRVMAMDALEHFPDVVRGVVEQHADERRLVGLARKFVTAVDRFRVEGLSSAFMQGIAVRSWLPSKETPQELLYKLAYPSKELRM